jgi:uncharacterized membrane protein YobD (UPF0266 family)
MSRDRRDLLKYVLILVLLIVTWFVLASSPSSTLMKVVLGWVGFGVIAVYYVWLTRHKVQPPKA